MDYTITLPNRGKTSFYFTDVPAGSAAAPAGAPTPAGAPAPAAVAPPCLSHSQQHYLVDLIRSLRERFPTLEINAVWDFGREEGDPARGEKYGDFALSKDNAVYNSQMLTISYNHVRCAAMPCETDRGTVRTILEEYAQVERLSARACEMEQEMMQEGVPYPQILPRINEIIPVDPGRENLLPLTDPLFAQVRAIRQLEDIQSLERLTLHEVGHILSEQGGRLNLKDSQKLQKKLKGSNPSHAKEIKRLYNTCQNGFENIFEFCAECFMANELTGGRIPLAYQLNGLLFTM